MPVDLSKIEAEAPHLVDLYKGVLDLSKDAGLDPEVYKAAVVGSFDFSGSTEMGSNKLYTGKRGKHQLMDEVGDLVFAAGFVFDDDGEIPASFFHNSVIDLGSVTPRNSNGFLARAAKSHRLGGTSYIAPITWMLEQAGFTLDQDEVRAWAQALRTRNFSGVDQLKVKGVSDYPTFGVLATDGEPADDQYMLLATLYVASQYPLFISTLGVGEARSYPALDGFSKLPTQAGDNSNAPDPYGRLVDNVGYFDTKKARNADQMLKLMLGEFPDYYKKVRRIEMVNI